MPFWGFQTSTLNPGPGGPRLFPPGRLRHELRIGCTAHSRMVVVSRCGCKVASSPSATLAAFASQCIAEFQEKEAAKPQARCASLLVRQTCRTCAMHCIMYLYLLFAALLWLCLSEALSGRRAKGREKPEPRKKGRFHRQTRPGIALLTGWRRRLLDRRCPRTLRLS